MVVAGSPAPLSTARRALCVGYALIAAVALVATWSQNLAYGVGTSTATAFLRDTTVTPAGRSITADILLLTLAVIVVMVIEARKHGVRFVWLYVAASLLTAISVTFPLFLIARERRLGAAGTARLRPVDTALLVVAGAAILAATVWVDTR